MKEYIDREAAIQATDGELEITGEENMTAVAEYIMGVVERLKALPAADMVCVTRCRDCKHFDGICMLRSNDLHWPGADGFCSAGERRRKIES